MSYTKEEIEAGNGCYTTMRTQICEIIEGEDRGKYVTCQVGDSMGNSLELAGYAHPKKNGFRIEWI